MPEASIDPEVITIPGLDGRKMSKSYDNVIPIFASEDQLHKRVMGIVTDSRSANEPKDPNSCTLFTLYRALASRLRPPRCARYENGSVGYGEVKRQLLELMRRTFGDARER